jgi:hypothetical protein
MVGLDLEFQIEGLACGNDTKILIENDQRLSNRIHDGVRKYPGVLDVNELFSEHVETLSRGGSLPNSQSLARPTAAEDRFNLRSLCDVSDTCLTFRLVATSAWRNARPWANEAHLVKWDAKTGKAKHKQGDNPR